MARRSITSSLIDPPSPFDGLANWKRHLQALHQLPATHLLKRALIQEAEETIARKTRTAWGEAVS